MAQTKTDDRLTPAQKRAVSAMLTSRNVTEAAQAAGVGRSTLCRWLTEDNFRAALSEAEGGLIDDATRRLTSLTDKAITTLSALLEPQTPVFARLRAAEAIIDHAIRLRELRTIEDRLARLEAALHGHETSVLTDQTA